jgi:hypothetical protein
MKEIRLRWREDISHHEYEIRDGGLWHPDTPENREKLQTIMEAAVEAYGPGSHWIEEREA